MKLTMKGLLCCLLTAVATACSSGSTITNWYQEGKSWSVAHNKADKARLMGPTPGQWCTHVLQLGQVSDPIGLTPPNTTGPEAQEWIRGCAAGYHEVKG